MPQDYRSLVLFGLLLNIAIAAGFTMILLVLRRQRPLWFWTGSLWLSALGMGLICLRGQVPDLLSIVFANTCVAMSKTLLLLGFASHVGWRGRWWLPWLPILLFLHGTVTFSLAWPSLTMRLELFSALAIVVDIWIIALLLRHGPAAIRLSGWLAISTFVLDACFSIARGLTPLAGHLGESLFDTSPAAMTMAYVATLVLMLTQCFALVLLTFDALLRELRVVARTDGLTGVLNRVALFDDGQRALARCRRQGLPFALLLLDLDNFKQVNDRWGHSVGDAVLCHFVRVVRSCGHERVRMLGRYGGEEFVMLLPGADLAHATAVAEQLRVQLASTPMDCGHRKLVVTISIGVAVADEGSDLDALLACADRAMYQAKAAGRDRVVVALPATASSEVVPATASAS